VSLTNLIGEKIDTALNKSIIDSVQQVRRHTFSGIILIRRKRRTNLFGDVDELFIEGTRH